MLIALLDDLRRDGSSLAGASGSGRDARLGEERDDPSRRAAGLNLHDRTNKRRNGRSLYGQCCLLTAMLIIAAAPRDFWISRLERLHA